MTERAALIKRLEEAEPKPVDYLYSGYALGHKLDWPSLELNWSIYKRVAPSRAKGIREDVERYGLHPSDGIKFERACAEKTPSLVTSLDTTVALVEEKLPRWMPRLTKYKAPDGQVRWEAELNPYDLEDEQYGRHNSPAIALLIALLHVLEKSDE